MNSSSPSDNTTWSVTPCCWKDAAKIAEELDVPQVVGMVLAGRGLSDATSARDFLECSEPLPDPYLFADMSGAVDAILSAIGEQRKIVVHGDYDADGVTATALMVDGLRALGADVDWYLPSRFREGYGLSAAAVEAIASDGASLLITVDCGVNYPQEVELAREHGLEVIVVDHHQPGEILPDCHLIHEGRGGYPDGDLCGVGLALKVLHAVHIRRSGAQSHRLPRELSASLDLVAIGTVADLSALRGENRYYVKEGLRLLNLGQRPGLRALCEVSGCSGSVDSGAIAFRLAPRLNAPGRLSDPTPPLRLLLTQDESEARKLASQLHEMNGERQDIERTMFDAAQRQVSAMEAMPRVLVLEGEDWHEGVVGIVASRMVERYQRPTIILSLHDGIAKGSGRSIPAYDLLGAIEANREWLSVYGGHAQAAGMTLRAVDVAEFRMGMQRHASTTLSEADLMPRYRADAVIRSDELGTETAQALNMLEPFGSGNPRPRLLVVDTILENTETTRNGRHLRCTAQVGGVRIPAIGFGMGEESGRLRPDQGYIAGAQLKADEWRGSLRPQLVLERVAAVERAYQRPHAQERVDPHTRADSDGGRPGPRGACRIHADSGPAGAAVDWPRSTRDLRDRPGRLTALAQVLGSGETVAMFTISAVRAVEQLDERLPMGAIAGGQSPYIVSVDRDIDVSALREARLVVVEWAATPLVGDTLNDRAHVVVFDPPYRARQTLVPQAIGDAGATVHLLYGEAERRETALLLRHLVHPRFAMVCVYNAMRTCGNADAEKISEAASALAWERARVVLAEEDLRRARTVLTELGLDTYEGGKAKLDAQANPAYRIAEADYEECVRTCLTL